MKVPSSIEYSALRRYLESEEMKISLLTISVFCHETEDLGKIRKSIELVIPSAVEGEIRSDQVKGHFGNYITLLEYRFSKSLAVKAFQDILNKLSSADMIVIITTLSERMEKSKLYLRFDKQYLVAKGELTLKEGNDVVRIMVSFNGPYKEVIKELKQIASNRAMHNEARSTKLS
ncbi:RNA-binding domain-containing protein [Sulfuracidifex metallicus]|nr:RNA-binding domain-containing protein [Sulfuracidifex metallicus]